MKTFLEYVAEDLLNKYGTNLSRTAVVFPNKRAALFLSEHLAKIAGVPVWSPAYITISNLFRQQTNIQVADSIKLICDLHHCFTEQTGLDETLDHFYGWGQLLLADFDDIDKNMADADRIFANLRDIHELDDISYLNEEQKEILKRFFSNFSPEHNTELKERFLKLWSKMGNIYHAFNERLSAQGLAYEGALYRKVVESTDLPFEYDQYIFAGFNLLQKVEQCLFTTLKKQGRAHFYWDFDHYYMLSAEQGSHANEAGHFIAQYLEEFPNELDVNDASIYHHFSEKKHISLISAPTEDAQARYISSWLREHPQEKKRISAGRKTAIVLCNEGLLQTVIHCLPNEVNKVNITTGYPLIQSPAASLVNILIKLQTTGYDTQRGCYRLKQVNTLLSHPYIDYISEEATNLQRRLNAQKTYYPDSKTLSVDEGTTLLFTHHEELLPLTTWLCNIMQTTAISIESNKQEKASADPLIQETIFRMYTVLNRLKGLIESGDLHIDIITFQRLIIQLVSSTSVPFHGEPIEGIQIMGVLETRNLDFEHLLILSCNEGNMPKGVDDTSYIPYNIRKAYGLTTIDHKVAIYSYYFHRLLQRANDITILYNNATSDGHTAEVSRFVLQLMVESQHEFSFHSLQTGQKYDSFRPHEIEKTSIIMEKLRQRFDVTKQTTQAFAPLLTPTAINRYMRCPLLFYYHYVCKLHEPNESDEDRIDNRIFGNIFHEAAQEIYSRLLEKSAQILESDIDHLLKKNIDIEMAVDRAFQKELFGNTQISTDALPHQPLNGLQLINREVIIHYLRQLLKIDKCLTPFNIIGLECDVVMPIQTNYITTTIGGRIDRLDQIIDNGDSSGTPTEKIRVIDYKTGSKRLSPIANVDAIFEMGNTGKHNDYYLQAILYSCIIRRSKQYNSAQLPVSPALLFIQHSATDNYDPTLYLGKDRIDDVDIYQQRFGELLIEKVNEIFNPDIAFYPIKDLQQCQTCPYYLICSQHK